MNSYLCILSDKVKSLYNLRNVMNMEARPKRTIEDVCAIARSFLITYGHGCSKLKSAEYDEKTKTWTLGFDVGIWDEEVITMKVDDESGRIVEFKCSKPRLERKG